MIIIFSLIPRVPLNIFQSYFGCQSETLMILKEFLLVVKKSLVSRQITHM